MVPVRAIDTGETTMGDVAVGAGGAGGGGGGVVTTGVGTGVGATGGGGGGVTGALVGWDGAVVAAVTVSVTGTRSMFEKLFGPDSPT